eukprot:CAMPEP_0117698008 /NCGR_PEP_ID=MMETSP0804-20121206/29539_1 /TAXON_ID=1074897 /ORGANISM="Tetraselmis astigmatica, Strain CCMP880" /LENGTH=36 /DNA_ID= /DNA_START= /DNA_END= /DNA_ORIENTATION=
MAKIVLPGPMGFKGPWLGENACIPTQAGSAKTAKGS